VSFLIHHPGVAFVLLGAVFLAVTGGEALYADLGHFGRRPITLAWFGLVLPALVLNYMGQGALVLAHPETARDPFFGMVGRGLLPVLVALTTLATVIAAQAVITGAFSMARGAVQLGFLPRLSHSPHRRGAERADLHRCGQLAAAGGRALAGPCLWLSSAALASAYGIAVTGTMVLTTTLGILLPDLRAGLRPAAAIAVAAPVAAVEFVFLASNLTKMRRRLCAGAGCGVAGFLMWSLVARHAGGARRGPRGWPCRSRALSG
jgi:KUP system potassium uptake protein